MNTVLLPLLLAAAAVNVIMLVMLLIRSSSSHTFAQDVREDLRVGREELRRSVKDLEGTTEAKLEATRGALDRSRDTLDARLDTVQKELATGLKTHSDTLIDTLERIRTTFDTRAEELKDRLDARVKEMQEGNERKLEEMRCTVDEKLEGTLEKRLGESFKFVSERLELVHKGLGEMQGLATGVGDLKRIFSNVKVRGTWAEVQLGGILEQILTPEQWSRNVCVREGSLERVECAIRLPGPKDERDRSLWLPIDSKFPTEDYGRLQAAAEAGDPVAVQAATDALLRALKTSAKDIHDRYVNPPATTDYAIMFLATEGLYAEALRQPQFVEELLQKYRIVVAGPTTLSAIVSSLRMGFQTLIVEQRAAEVWRVLGAVKTEFGKFGGTLERVRRQLDTASRTIDETGIRTRAMTRRLQAVERMEEADAAEVLGLSPAALELESELAEGGVADTAPVTKAMGRG
jgi:DNA recombination protein RmuC